MKTLNRKELETYNGGDFGTTVVIGIALMATYEHGKRYLVGLFNPFENNE